MGELAYHDFFLQNWQKLFGPTGKRQPSVVVWPDEARPRMGVLYGGIGTGKTQLVTALASFDAFKRVAGLSPRGFALLDNQEDLFNSVFDRLALLALIYPALYDLVYIIDPTNKDWSIKYDLCELQPWETPEAKSSQLALDFMYLFEDDPKIHVRQYRITSLSFLALILDRRPVLDLPMFLTDRPFREALVKRLGHPVLTSYWLHQFPQRHADAMAWIESTMSRVERFIYMNEGIQFMLEGPSTINFRALMDGGAIILVNAPIRLLKDSPSSLFLGSILGGLRDAAMSRTDIPLHKRVPFTAYCDEFQEYTTDAIRQGFALGRKLRWELFLSTQNVQALRKQDELREILRELAGNILTMRLGRRDAEILYKYLFTPEIDQIKAYVENKPVFRGLNEIQEFEIRKLTECPDRMVYWKRIGYPGSHYFRTPTVTDLESLPNYLLLPEARRRLEMAAFRLAGRLKVKRLPAPRQMPQDGQEAPVGAEGGEGRTKRVGFWSD